MFKKILYVFLFSIFGLALVFGSVFAITRVMVPQGGTGSGHHASSTILIGRDHNSVTTTDYTIPMEDGLANQILKTDGAGGLTWQTDSDANIFNQWLDTTNTPQFAGLLSTASTTIGNSLVVVDDLTVQGNVRATTSLDFWLNASTTNATAADITADIATHAADNDAHQALVTLTGQDYLTLSTQQITAGEIEPDDLANSDFGGFDCNGTTCTIDDLFLKNSVADTTAFGLTIGSATTTDSLYIGGFASSTGDVNTQANLHIGGTGEVEGTFTLPTLGTAAGAFIAVNVSGDVITTTTPAAGHDAVTLAGTPDYLTLSTQEITLTKLDMSDDTNLVAGTNITLSTNTLNVDDAFLVNDANDTTSGGLTMNSGTTTDSFYVGGPFLQMTTAGDNFIYFDNATTEYFSWDDAPGEFDLTDDLNVVGVVSSTQGFRTTDLFQVDNLGHTTTSRLDITDGTNGLRIVPGATTTLEAY